MSLTIDELPAPHRGAKSLLLTLLGEFVHPTGGAVWTSTLVQGLATVDITERNARQAIARLGEQGIVEAERRGRRTRWRLTDAGSRLLTAGTERIYSFGRRHLDWDGNWLLVICSIPETQRAIRHQFRTQLTFEGFGFLSPTIAISPHTNRERAANEILRELGLAADATTFVATSGTMTADDAIRAGAWDLDAVADEYAAFIAEFGDEAGDAPSRPVRPAAPADAFGTTLLLVDSWRRFPFTDPELPCQLLPADWIGDRAGDLFARRRAAVRSEAMAWYRQLEADAS